MVDAELLHPDLLQYFLDVSHVFLHDFVDEKKVDCLHIRHETFRAGHIGFIKPHIVLGSKLLLIKMSNCDKASSASSKSDIVLGSGTAGRNSSS